MINKRLLIKKLLSQTNENSFFDKKRELNIDTKEGKAKFVKHICALSNSNPDNNSFIVVGVEDDPNKIVGVDFFDDSKIQNLINASLVNPPKITYENIAFPRLPKYKVVGLVTIFPNPEISRLNKSLWKYYKGTTFYRIGSNSLPVRDIPQNMSSNKGIVKAIERSASSNIEHTLDGVFDFMDSHSDEHNPRYKVFKEQFVICWAGKKKVINDEEYYSRVDIELINEQVRIFYSSLDDVKIKFNKSTFLITEYVRLGIGDEFRYYPFEKTVLNFKDNGQYDIVSEMLFDPPKYSEDLIERLYENNNQVLEKLISGEELSSLEYEEFISFPTTYLICAINGKPVSYHQLKKTKPFLRALENKIPYIQYKESIRILRKLKYQ